MKESRIALFAGSFDPVTLGHVDVIQRGARLFDKLVVAIGENSSKAYMYGLEQRLAWLRRLNLAPNVEIASYTGLTVEYAAKCGAQVLIRAVRSALDLEYERTVAQLNERLHPGMETVIMISKAVLSDISSTLVREIVRNQGNPEGLVPEEIIEEVRLGG